MLLQLNNIKIFLNEDYNYLPGIPVVVLVDVVVVVVVVVDVVVIWINEIQAENGFNKNSSVPFFNDLAIIWPFILP